MTHPRLLSGLKSIDSLTSGQNMWFWMTTAGPDGAPFLVLVSQAADPEGVTFMQRVRWTIRTSGRLAPFVRGVLCRTSSGQLTLATQDDLGEVETIYAALCRRVALPDLLLLRLDGERIASSRLAENLAASEETLARLRPGEVASFFLESGEQTARIFVDPDHSVVKRRATGAAIVGKVRRSGKGNLVLRIRPDAVGQIGAALQRWSEHHAGWAALGSLHTARITVR